MFRRDRAPMKKSAWRRGSNLNINTARRSRRAFKFDIISYYQIKLKPLSDPIARRSLFLHVNGEIQQKHCKIH
jgi:hypothetical protein